jgi:alpha-L-fucosidase
MNEMVFELQPEIIVNNRNGRRRLLHAGAAHPGAEAGRAWETCMTLNDSWGFNRGDDAWKTPKTIVDNLITCARGGGNYLLNIGPKPDGSIPPESVEILETVGKWLDTNGKTIYGTERNEGPVDLEPELHAPRQHALHACALWPGHTPAAEWLDFYKPEVVVAIGGLKPKALSARCSRPARRSSSRRMSSL